jgi:hypothetical protein
MLKSLAISCLLALAVGCTTQTGRELSTRDGVGELSQGVSLPPPARGFQVETAGIRIEPGDDLRLCEVVALPGTPSDTYYVNRIETAFSRHGDDLVVSAARPQSETAAIMDVGSSVPCTRAGEAFGEELADVVATQSRYHDESFPSGVGKVFHGGQKLAVEYHYVNDTADAVPAKAKLSFHIVDPGAVQHLARTASFSNLTIYTPPGGESSHLGECALHEDVTISSLVRRSQRFATDFAVWRVGGQHDGELVWQSDDPSHSRLDISGQPLQLAPGEGLRFQCGFRNTTDRELRYGVSAADDTCTLNATFWAKDEAAAQPEGCLLFSVDEDGVAR